MPFAKSSPSSGSAAGKRSSGRELSPLERAARMLSQRPLASKELKKKLQAKGIDWRTAADTVRECERLGFINDPLVAEQTVSGMRSRGDGSRKIKMKMRLRGFAQDDIENAFANDDANEERSELDVACAVLIKKRKSLEREPDKLKRRMKAIRALAAKGFSSGTAYAAMEKVFGKGRFATPDPDEQDAEDQAR